MNRNAQMPRSNKDSMRSGVVVNSGLARAYSASASTTAYSEDKEFAEDW